MTTESSRKQVMAVMHSTVQSNPNYTDEWYTPPQYLEAARRVMGGMQKKYCKSVCKQKAYRLTTVT